MRFLRRFIRNRRGAVIMLIALNFLLMASITGAAIDTARAYYLKSEMMSALDSAALAGGASVNAKDFNAIVNKYFTVNMASSTLGGQISDLKITVDAGKQHITLSTTGTLGGTLQKVASGGSSSTSVSNEVTIQRSGLELALVMDNTGSMGTTNMASMKAAAASLVNIVYGPNDTVDNLWVALVPYVSMVNIGTQHASWLGTAVNTASYTPTAWKGCVFARGDEISEGNFHAVSALDAKAGGPFTAFLWDSSSDNPWKCTGANAPFNNCQNEMALSRHRSTTGAAASQWHTTNSVNINENQGAGNNGTGPNLGCGPAVIGLTASKTSVLSAITAMNSWSRGGTNSGVGLAWGWRTLSPNWQGLWGGVTPATLPMAYHTAKMSKAVVILTDGNNEWYDYDTATSDNYSTNETNYKGDMTAYKRPEDNVLGTTNVSTATTILNNNFASMCTKMKAEGIIIYTITFNLTDTNVQNLWKTCASSPSFYFNSPTASQLNGIFTTIGDSLSNLRISK